MSTLEKDVSAKLRKAEKALSDLNDERDSLFEQRKPIDDALLENYKKIEKAQNKVNSLRQAQMSDEYDWAVLLDPDNVSTLFNLYSKAIRSLGLYPSGYWSDTNQPCAKVMIQKDQAPGSTAEALTAIKTLVPFYTPHSDGAVWFGIFEHTLSAGGVYRLEVKPDLLSARVSIIRYGRQSSVTEWNSLEKTLEYVTKHLYYE